MHYLTARGDSSVKRSQPLVIFGINSGSLDESERESVSMTADAANTNTNMVETCKADSLETN